MFSSLLNRRAALGQLSLSAVLALAPKLAAAQTPNSEGGAVDAAISEPFSPDLLRDKARALAAAPYAKPPAPATITGLTYDEYFQIRFRKDADLWKDRTPAFRAEFFPPAWLYPRPLPIFEVVAGLARPIAFDPAMFDIPGEHADVAKSWNGFSGFRLLWPLNEPGKMDEVAVFQGASYFRSLGRGQRYGLSARGLAIGAGEPNEEFPDFTSFWLERPAIDGDAVVVHALMDSPSCAGAYSFTIRPGDDVVFEVSASIFPRATMTKTGVAAMSSMFLFNVADASPVDDYRTGVHDSDGLAIWTGRDEHIWRPLQNPKAHRLSSFLDQDPKGFGLVQRARTLEDFGDLQARYDLRPSLWVEPLDAWGEGAVHLAELATTKETDDNIAIFWRPKSPWKAGSQVDLRYRLHWGQERFASPDARVFRTRTGADAKAGLRLFTVDLQGGALAEGLDGVAMDLQAQGGEIVWRDLSPYPDEAAARVAFGVRPKAANMDLTLRLTRGDQVVSETWKYLWTA
ncbi:glucan biosynthesis protein G [Caulobacter soli]|uniref:glucan biosynthesis protein G n=1 Tax=Caulobacter soli TaxID=2708539 RepID=UPI0013EAF1AD|nr:glucan biosynthesis protein G [Caulobacter soli]